MKKQISNIQNIAFTIMNEPSDDKKKRAAGVTVDQTLVNGNSQGVSFRLINGAQKSAAVKLDRKCLANLREALEEVLAVEQA